MRARSFAGAAVASLALACTPPIPEGQYLCTDAVSDCPPGWVCAAGRCYSTPQSIDGGRRDGGVGLDAPRDDSGRDGGRLDGGPPDSGPVDAGAGMPIGVAASELHTCAWTSTGRAFCWGDRSVGQLGDGTTSTSTPRTTAVRFIGLETAVTEIAAGAYHTCALVESGDVWCVGANVEGSLGDGSGSTLETDPVRAALAGPARRVAAGGAHTCVVMDDGTVRCWGRNDNGQVGNGAMANALVPAAAVGIAAAVAVGCGIAHSCALLESGAVFCWGANSAGQLGVATVPDGRASPVPLEVAGVTAATALTVGGDHACAVLDDGRVACWGANASFQLGDTATGGPTAHVVSLPGGLRPTALTANGFRPIFIPTGLTCAMAAGEPAVCFGYNAAGQLGIGRGSARELPMQVTVVGPPSALAAGPRHACAVVGSDVRCWGDNEKGQLGDSTTTIRPTSAVTVVGIE